MWSGAASSSRRRCASSDDGHLLRIVNQIVAAVGRRVDESQPMIDARLADGSRINAAMRPIAVDGPLVSIRKFSEKALDLEQLVSIGAMPARMSRIAARRPSGRGSTVLVSGGTGSGKTTPAQRALGQHLPQASG